MPINFFVPASNRESGVGSCTSTYELRLIFIRRQGVSEALKSGSARPDPVASVTESDAVFRIGISYDYLFTKKI